jgi:hypothetical protein
MPRTTVGRSSPYGKSLHVSKKDSEILLSRSSVLGTIITFCVFDGDGVLFHPKYMVIFTVAGIGDPRWAVSGIK